MDGLYTIFTTFVNGCTDVLETVLPTSPFQKYIQACGDIPWIGIVNYFIPIGTFLSIFLAWLSCLAIFYIYSIIMRWAKIIGE